MSSNKEYQAGEQMVQNIIYMLNNSATQQINKISTYYRQQEATVQKYRNSLLPKLRSLIERSKQTQNGRSINNSQQVTYNDLDIKVSLYQSVIGQMSKTHTRESKQKLLNFYRTNSYKLQNQTTKQCIQNIISFEQTLQDYQSSKNAVSSIVDEFKDHIMLDKDHRLSENIRKIRHYLLRTKAQQLNKIAPFDEVTSISILLNNCITQFKIKAPITQHQQYLQNIKLETISSPFLELIELLNQHSKIKKQQQNKASQKDNIVEGQQNYEMQLLMQIYPQIICNIYKFIQQKVLKNISDVNQQQLINLNIKLEQKMSEFTQMKYRVRKYQQFSSKIKQQVLIKDQQLIQQAKKIENLKTQEQNLKYQLQEIQKSLNFYCTTSQDQLGLLMEKDTIISNLQKQKNILQAPISQQNSHYFPQRERLKTQNQQINKQKNELLTQVLYLKHELDDERLSSKQKYEEQLAHEVAKAIKQVKQEKQNQIKRIQERRRNQKSKLNQQTIQLMEELQEFKEKYYRQIGIKLSQSRLDISICQSDKGVGNSILNESNFLNGLEEEVKNEENEGNLSQNIEELEKQFKKQFEEKIDKLMKENSQLKSQLETKASQLLNISQKLTQRQKQIKLFTSQLEQGSKMLTQIQQEATLYKNKCAQVTLLNRKYETTLKQYAGLKNKNQVQSEICQPTLISYDKMLFQGLIFEQDDQGKEILIRHLTNYASSYLTRTRLLFQYNPHNKANFHLFIDNKRHLLCVVRTRQVLIAGYYPGELKDNGILNEGGLLISVTNDKSYRLLEKNSENSKVNYRGMTYDAYYAVFGNAQMRIRSGENRVFSNFGIQNGYFNYQNSSKSVDNFLGDGDNREVQFQYCQFYQLYFENETLFNHPTRQTNQDIFRSY